MALEDLTGTKYIDDLVSTNPAAGDNVSEGDDHIRGIKNVLKTTFPSIDGAITATDTEINYVDGVTSNVQTQFNAITADDWVTTARIADGAVDTARLGADAVTGAKIADDAIDSEHYTDGSIDTAHIGDNQVTAAKVAADVATQAELDTVSTTASAALPKAGGAMTGNTTHADNVKALYGTGNDLEIYHDSSDSIISDTGTGSMLLMSNGNGVYVQKGSSETMAQFVADGAVKLYYDNSKKFETTSGGVNVVGAIYGATHVGTDSGDDIQFVNNTDQRFHVNGGEEMRLEADGDLHVDGDVIAFSTTVSDATLKYDINLVDHALEKINQLKGVSYKYKHNDRESAGLLAQDVEKIMPSAVKTKKLPLATGDDKEYKTLHYDSMTAILVEAIKELTAKVKKLESK